MDLNNWSVGNNSWFMQKAQASLWKIKPEWLTQTDWNTDENHGNRLFSKQFIEARSETRHLGKDGFVLISAYQHLRRPKFLSNRCVKRACPCLSSLAENGRIFFIFFFLLRCSKRVMLEPKVTPCAQLQYGLFSQQHRLSLHLETKGSAPLNIPSL